MAVQLKGTNGFFARAEKPWIARARISLPVPLSPVMRTVTLVRATFAREQHQFAHASGDHRVVAFEGRFVDRPERQPFFAFGLGALEVVDRAEENGDGVQRRLRLDVRQRGDAHFDGSIAGVSERQCPRYRARLDGAERRKFFTDAILVPRDATAAGCAVASSRIAISPLAIKAGGLDG